MILDTHEAAPGEWVTVTPDVDPGLDEHTIVIGGVVQPAFVEDGRLLVRMPADVEVSSAGYVMVTVDGVRTDRLIRMG